MAMSGKVALQCNGEVTAPPRANAFCKEIEGRGVYAVAAVRMKYLVDISHVDGLTIHIKSRVFSQRRIDLNYIAKTLRFLIKKIKELMG